MEFSYFSGWFIAFLIGVIRVMSAISVLLSLKASNLKKVGEHYHPMRAKFVNFKPSIGSKIFFVIWAILLAPLGSWISVISALWSLVTYKTNKTDPPDAMKEITFKLSTQVLSKNEMQDLFARLTKLRLTQEANKISESENCMIIKSAMELEVFSLELGDEEWPYKMYLDPSRKRLETSSRTPDYLTSWSSIIIYRIEGLKLFFKTIESKSEELGKVEVEIEDGVVIESEIRESYKGNRFINADEKIEQLNKEVEWHEIENWKIKHFIFSHHTDLVKPLELRKEIRKDIERIKNGVAKLIEQAKATKVEINLESKDRVFTVPKEISELELAEIHHIFSEENLRNLNLSDNEATDYPPILRTLEELLAKKNAA